MHQFEVSTVIYNSKKYWKPVELKKINHGGTKRKLRGMARKTDDYFHILSKQESLWAFGLYIQFLAFSTSVLNL